MSNKDLFYYNNPEAFQLDIINGMDKVFNTDNSNTIVVEPNSTVGFLIDAFSNISASIVKGIETKLNTLYPKRAQDINDIYNHISDYDYISFQANPTSYKINIKMAKKILKSTAVDFNEFYNLLVIPRTTVFKVGSLSFSMYYDIFIKVNKNTGNILVNYNTEINNPLKTLDNYNIPYSEFSYMGVDYISFEIEIYQFAKETFTESLDSSVGFYKSYNYQDKFYAIRIFDTINNFEFQYSLSEIIYNLDKPTAIIKVISDENKIDIYIPQIYFTNNQISSNIKIDLYTTKGKLDINVDTSNINFITAKFISDDIFITDFLPYITPLKNIKSILFIPIENKIIGGKDSDKFDIIKNNVIYNLYSNRVLISEKDIYNFFQNYGFKVINRVDNLTKRVYYLINYITTSNHLNRLSIVNGKLEFDINKIDDYQNTILSISRDNYVILPNTIYKYDRIRNLIYPIDKNKETYLNTLNKLDTLNEFNNKDYLFYPYHLLINTELSYPSTTSYDLLDNEINNVVFDNENPYIDYQIYLNDIIIEHLNNGCDGYKITFGIEKNEITSKLIEDDIVIYLTLKTSSSKLIGKRLTFDSQQDKLSIYTCILNTDYYLDQENIRLTNIDYQPGYLGGIFVPLVTKANLIFHVKSNQLDNSQNYQNYDLFESDIMRPFFTDLHDNFYDDTWIAVSKFKFKIKFGEMLKSLIDNNTLVTYNKQEYVKYNSDEPLLYEHDVYERDNSGKFIYSYDNNNNIQLNIIHHQGDIVYDNNNNIIYKHKKDDNILDGDGNPIIAIDRSLVCSIDMFGINYIYKLDQSFNVNEINKILKSYYSLIIENSKNLYGNTLCYFRPITTQGIDEFYTSINKTTKMNFDISVGFKIYSSRELFQNTQNLNLISDNIKTMIKEYIYTNTTITLTELAKQIKDKYTEYIYSIDIKGIDDDVNTQSIIKIDNDKDIIIKSLLKLDINNNYILEDAIDLEFVPVDK